MTDVSIRQRALGPGWAEMVIVIPRPIPDTPDFDLVGEDAKRKIAKFMLAYVAGMASQLGAHDVAEGCMALAQHLGCFEPQGS